MSTDVQDDIQDVRAMLAPANPCPPGSLAGAAQDAIGRAAFAQVTASAPRTQPPPRSRQAGVRLVAVGGLAVAVAAGTTVAQNLGGTDEKGELRRVAPVLPQGPVAHAQEVLREAADTAQHRSVPPPRPDQWAYLETRYRRIGKGGDGEVRTPRSPLRTEIDRAWTRADGKKIAFFQNGRLVVSNTGGAMPPQDYATLTTLPRDPDALLAYVRAQRPPGDDTGFGLLGSILSNSVLPPAQEAATFRAIAKIPGVGVNKHAKDARGRPALAVSLTTDWLKDEILLDPATYAYRGHRASAVKDHTFPYEGSRWTIKKGTVESESARLAAGFVDRPGQRP